MIEFDKSDIAPYTHDRDACVDQRQRNMQELISASAPKDTQTTADMQPQLLIDSARKVLVADVEESPDQEYGIYRIPTVYILF